MTITSDDLLYYQKDPWEAICEALQYQIYSRFAEIKFALEGWPDTKFISIDGNLPSIFFLDIDGGQSENKVSRLQEHKRVYFPDGTGLIFTEQQRKTFILQMSLFTYTKEDRARLGIVIERYFETNYHIPLREFSCAIPGTGNLLKQEFVQMLPRGAPHDGQGETRFYQRDFTFEATGRIFDIKTAYQVTEVIKSITAK